MSVRLCLGKDSQHGAGQRLRRGNRSGQSVADDPRVRGFSVCDGFFVPLTVHAARGIYFRRSKHNRI